MQTPTAASAGSGSATIERRSNLSYQEFVRDYRLPRKPVIITDGLQRWPALTKWTPEYFKRAYGDKIITVAGAKMSLSDYVDAVLASTDEKPSPYLSGFLVRDYFPEVAGDILPDLKYTLPDRLRSRFMVGSMANRKGIIELLMSGRGGSFRLHFDTLHIHGFITQIYGEKEVMLFDPMDGPYLYPMQEPPNRSAITNAFTVDLEKFPLFAEATPYRTILKPGETLFNPPEWWHMTRNLTPSIAMVTSTVDATNWQMFVHDVASRPRGGLSRVVSPLLRSYFAVVGAALSAKERLARPTEH